MHKERVKQQERQIKTLELQMQHYKAQQSMFNYLRNDLHNFKEVFEKARDAETMYSPLTPTH